MWFVANVYWVGTFDVILALGLVLVDLSPLSLFLEWHQLFLSNICIKWFLTSGVLVWLTYSMSLRAKEPLFTSKT